MPDPTQPNEPNVPNRPGTPGGPGAQPPQGAPPYGPGAAAQPPPRQPGLWRQATSTRGGVIAVVVAACLAALLVLGLAAAGVVVAARVVAGHHAGNRIERMMDRQDGTLPPGAQKRQDRLPKDRVVPRGPGPGGGAQGNGLGPLLRGAEGLGALQHGEVTVEGPDGKPTAMTVQRGSVTAASSTKVTVRSRDGFTASYAVDSSTRGRTSGLKAGDEVLVVATKDGAKAVLVRVARAAG
jgi:hypothetical protein